MANLRIAGFIRITTLTLLIGMAAASNAPAYADPPDAPFASAYSQGLDALEQGEWTAAVKHFSAAIDADEDSADGHTARGVARVLAEDFPGALKDLERAGNLQQDNFDAKLWKAAAYFMNNDAQKGSLIFSMGSSQEHDYAGVVQKMFRRYSDSKFRGGYYDEEQRKRVSATTAVKTGFQPAALAFVRRHRASAPAAKGTADAAETLMQKGEFAAAVAKIELLRAANPTDSELLYLHAVASLRAGDAITARKEFTERLTTDPGFFLMGYVGRASAAAAMGDVVRTKADFGRTTGSEVMMGGLPPQVKQAIDAKVPPKEDIKALSQKLLADARTGKSDAELIETALQLCSVAACHRRRLDEYYQVKIHELTFGRGIAPSTADGFAALGEFLYKEATRVRGESVEPRSAHETYRPTTNESLAAELKRAEESLDAALKVQPDHVRALTYKAGCLAWRLKWEEAEKVVKKAMALAPSSPEILELFSQLLDHAASVKSAKASNLRSVDSWSDLSYIYWRSPSQAELEQADVYETQAEELWRLANEYLGAAAKAAAGTAMGDYYNGVIARRNKDLPAARAAFEKAVEQAPDLVQARDQLSAIYSGLGMVAEAHRQQAHAVNVTHTTAGPMLRLAWLETARTARKGARAAAMEAWEWDAVDPRCAAYMAVIERDAEKHGESIAWSRVALALLEARMRIHGQPAGVAKPLPIHDEDLGLLLGVRLMLAAEQQAAGQADAAMKTYESIVALEPRIDEEQMRRVVVVGMLPNPGGDQTRIPEPDPMVVYVADAHIQLGNASIERGDVKAAREHFAAVNKMVANWPPTAHGRERLYTVSSWGRIGMVRVLAAEGKVQEADRLLNFDGWPGGLPDELKKMIDEQKKVIRARKGR